MNSMMRLLLAAALFCCAQNSVGQPSFKPLKKGEVLPSVSFQVHASGKTTNVNLQDYKGKLLLLDFWGVHCGDCIASLPHMLELQKQFGGKVEVLLVTSNSMGDVQALWDRFEKKNPTPLWVNAGKQLPFVVEDTVLNALFPHSVLPTHVWIDTNLKVKGIMYPASTTSSNIQAYFQGQQLHFDEQKSFDLNIDAPLTWFRDSIVGNGTTPYYCFVTKHIEYGNGARQTVRYLKDSLTKNITGIICVNNSILDLYKIAYKEQMKFIGMFPNNRIIVETKDSTRFFCNEGDYNSWLKKKSFCFAFKQPPSGSSEFFTTMKKNLDYSFGLISSVEKRKMKVWVLTKTGYGKELHTRGGPEVYEIGSHHLVIQNLPFQSLVGALKDVLGLQTPEMFFVDETSFTGRFDIRLPWNPQMEEISIPELDESLRSFGLELLQEQREIDMLVIRDLKGK